jgi:hypothetical protein
MRIFFVALILAILPGCSNRSTYNCDEIHYKPYNRSPAQRELNRRMFALKCIKYQVIHGKDIEPIWDDYDFYMEEDDARDR